MKHLLKTSVIYCLLTLSLLASTSNFASNPPPIDPSLAPMLKKVLPSIVNIHGMIKITDINLLRELAKRSGNQGGKLSPKTISSVGSGVIVDSEKGYIITNAHVIKDAQMITVTLSDSRHFTAKVIGMDAPSDIALLQIKATKLTAAPMGNSSDLSVGDYVAAIGNPFGLSQTVTSGIISALGRTTLGIENYESFIQTDAPINPGNSGGALINLKGQLIGINTAILASSNKGSIGIGFAIPSNIVKSVMDQIIKFGDVKRGILGIGAQNVTPDLVAAFNVPIKDGAAVTQVLPGSAAAAAGFQVGDIVTKVNGVPIKNASDVVNTVGFLRVNSKINIELLRQTKMLTLSVTLSDPKQREKNIELLDPFLYGITMKNFYALSPLHGQVRGVLMMDVKEDSNAWQADLRPGDVVTSVNQQPITNMAEFKAVTAKAKDKLLLNVIRGASALFLIINRLDS